MRHLFVILALICAPGIAAAQDATGTWATERTPDGQLHIQVAPCGAALCGTIVAAFGPNGETGPYEHMGRRMVWDMAPSGAGEWRGGKIWDPRNDRTFNSRMSLSGRQLTVSGCVLGLCQGQVWTRVN